MPNLFDYVEKFGQQTFTQHPFGAPDSLALTQIVYMPMEDFPDGATVKELEAHLTQAWPDDFADPFQRKRRRFTEACAASERFGRLVIRDFVNEIDTERETQFSACVFDLPDGARYVAFRGTDLTIAGWKEDLNMSFMAVPAQRKAVAYIRRIAAAAEGPLYIGGHSKGGHLALYAAAHAAEKTQTRIQKAYSFDGQGVDESTLNGKGYARIRERIDSFIPQSSVVGMLLCYHPSYTVVHSTALGLLQHDALTWQIKDDEFNTLDGLDLGTRVADEALRQWIDKLSLSERRMLTDTVFHVISTLDTETFDPLVQDWPASSLKLIGAFRKLEPEIRTEMRRLLGDLFSSGASETARLLLPAVFRHSGEIATPIQQLHQQVRQQEVELREKIHKIFTPKANKDDDTSQSS
ncbi:MAG: DUF2974 domain-containing protein [Eubacteriales bacterium]|nr:DUF2974 domain-containing protein [Eubacteriales bacterium]